MSKLLTENINRVWSSLIINEFINNHITHYYLSPGMRNAPLIAALVFYQKTNNNIKIFTCIDERGASYRALGYSKATGKACVLLCTSGTALANYFPAVIEASKSNIPLIVLSADRPKEQILSGDNQTINQQNIFGEYVKFNLDLGVPTLEITPRDLATSVSHLIAKAMAQESGPVHFNCPFREPLENTIHPIPENYKIDALNVINKSSPATHYLRSISNLQRADLENLAAKFSKARSGILVIGSLPPSTDLTPVKNFINTLKWPVYLDVSSSLKYEYSLEDNAIPTFDHPEVLSELISHPPEIIFHIGGRLTSKHYYSYLQSLSSTELITLNPSSDKEDPAHFTKTRINSDIIPVLSGLENCLTATCPSNKLSLKFKNFIEQKRKIIEDGPLSYPAISKAIIETLKDDSVLYIANSTIVRSFDSYSDINSKRKFAIATNRGVSGIEGFIASACGFIDGVSKEVYLIIGDVSFMHDLNSLFFLKQLPINLKIILINNYGGGIFTLLPINKEQEVLSYITSPHSENFENIAKNFDIKYMAIKDVQKMQPALSELVATPTHTILEIFVDHQLNKLVYDQLRTVKLS